MGSTPNLDRSCSFGEHIDHLCHAWIYSQHPTKWDGLRGGRCAFLVAVLIAEVSNWHSEAVILNVYYISRCDYQIDTSSLAFEIRVLRFALCEEGS